MTAPLQDSIMITDIDTPAAATSIAANPRLQPFSVAVLVQAIRSANTLEELKRLVGPDSDDVQIAKKRVDAIEAIWASNGNNMQAWPPFVRERYDRLTAEQTAYENNHC